MKAEWSNPGTYIVVFKPESFASLPEYAESRERQPSGCNLNSSISTGSGSPGEYSMEVASPCSPIDDPNVVILPKFEDSLSSGHVCHKSERGPSCPPDTFDLAQKTDTEGHYASPEAPRFRLPHTLHTPPTYPKDLPAHRDVDRSIQLDLSRLHQDLLFLAAELGWLASWWRLVDLGATSLCASSRSERLNQVRRAQQALRELWVSSGMGSHEQLANLLAYGPEEILQKVHG